MGFTSQQTWSHHIEAISAAGFVTFVQRKRPRIQWVAPSFTVPSVFLGGHGDVREMPRGHVENIYDYDYKLLLDLFDLFGVNVDHTYSLHIPRISSWYVETLVFPFLLVDGWRLFGSIDSSTARFGSWALMGMREQLDRKLSEFDGKETWQWTIPHLVWWCLMIMMIAR